MWFFYRKDSYIISKDTKQILIIFNFKLVQEYTKKK